MENEVDLSSGNPLDLTPKGPLAFENLSSSAGPDLSSTPNRGPGSSPLYPGQGAGVLGSNKTVYPEQSGNPLDDAERILKAKRDRMQIGLTGPMSGMLQFLAPKEVEKLGAEAAETDLKIQGIQEKRQQQKDMQKAGDLAGLPPGTLPATATNDTLVNEMTNRFRTTGDPKVMEALIARGHKDIVATYMPDAVAAQETKVYREKQVIDALDSVTNQAEYNGILKTLPTQERKSEKLPATLSEWKAKRAQIFNDNQTSLQMVANFKQQRAQWSDFTPETDKNAAEVRQNSMKLANGEVMPGTTAVKHLGNGATGLAMPQGSNNFRMFGEKGANSWSFFGDKQKEAISKETEAAVPKTEREKYVSFARTYKMATQDKDGNRLDEEATKNLINTNPNVQQAISEGLASALRGGAGGANGQLMKLELAKRGVVQETVDKAVSALAGTGAITGKERDYLSKLTQAQVRYVLDFVKNYSDADMGTRLTGVAERTGIYGGRLDQIGLEPELQEAAKAAHAYGRDLQKYKLSQNPVIIRDNDAVLLQGGKAAMAVPGATVTPLPLSALPGLTPKISGDTDRTAREAGSPAASAIVRSPSGGGGGTPTIPTNIAKNPVALTIYGAAGQAIAGDGPATSRNAAIITTSAARSESSFNPNAMHPEKGGIVGYGLFGHNQDRLEAMHKFAGTKADEPITPEVQAQFFVKEMSEAAGKDAFIKETIKNPNANAADLTKVQIRLEKPAGYTGPGSEEKVPSWNQRLSNTQALMQGGKTQPTAEQIAAYNANREGLAVARAKMAASATRNAANIAPALGATAGMLAGPAGALAGGAAGGAVRQAFNGGPGYVDQMARGALEAIPAAIPGVRPLATTARVVAGGAVPAAEKLYDSGGEDVGGAIESGAAGAVGGVVGEAFGRALGMAGHKIYSHLASSSQAETMAAAKVLATQEPKIADATEKMVPNIAYDKAEQFVKDRGLDVEHAAYAYNVSKQGVASASVNPKDAVPGAALPQGQALAQRPGMTEAARIGRQEYQPIREEVATAGGNIPVPSHAKLPNGPSSVIVTAQNPNGVVPDTQFWRDQTQKYGMRAIAPAKNVDEKWQRLGSDRSELLKKERDAMASDHPNKDEFVKGFRAIADSLRAQQEAMAKALLPPAKATALIQRLEVADVRYRNAMTAGGPDIVKTIAKGGTDGLKAQAAFDALAANDPAAKRMVNALVAEEKGTGLRKGVAGTLALITIPLHGVPIVGQALSAATATVSAVQGTRLLREWMAKKGAGAPVKFETILKREIASKGYAARAGSVIGSSTGAAMTQ